MNYVTRPNCVWSDSHPEQQLKDIKNTPGLLQVGPLPYPCTFQHKHVKRTQCPSTTGQSLARATLVTVTQLEIAMQLKSCLQICR